MSETVTGHLDRAIAALDQARDTVGEMIDDTAQLSATMIACAAAEASFALLDPQTRHRVWLTLGSDNLPARHDESYVAAIKSLAGFVRMAPDAPAEALYRHARAQAIHDGDLGAWREQPVGVRLSFSVFRMVLIAADALLTDEIRRAKAEAAGRTPAPADVIPIEDTMLAPSTDPGAIHDDLVRDDRRKMRIIPAKGLPPGHRVESGSAGRKRGGAWDLPDGPLGRSGEEPTRPPPDIGPSNTTYLCEGLPVDPPKADRKAAKAG